MLCPTAQAYAASKWGLNGLSLFCREELREHGIRVSVVCPGSTNTELSPHVGKDPQRMLQPEDVAHAVGMLVTQSPQSSAANSSCARRSGPDCLVRNSRAGKDAGGGSTPATNLGDNKALPSCRTRLMGRQRPQATADN